jgi:hypothetical protein
MSIDSHDMDAVIRGTKKTRYNFKVGIQSNVLKDFACRLMYIVIGSYARISGVRRRKGIDYTVLILKIKMSLMNTQ